MTPTDAEYVYLARGGGGITIKFLFACGQPFEASEADLHLPDPPQADPPQTG